MPLRKVIHIDMDAFYSPIEQRENRPLRDRLVPVGDGAKRGVVAAASYEARAYDVRRPCVHHGHAPVPRAGLRAAALRHLSRGVAPNPRFFADYTSLIEPLALDEAYLDVTENRRDLTTASAFSY